MAVALITGAGRGIGRLLAHGLAEHGMTVVLAGRRRERLDAVAAECAERGARASTVLVDVRDPEAVRTAVRSVHAEVGGIDLLVNNAGAVDREETPFWAADQDDWWDVFETNVRGTVAMCRAALPDMIARGAGRIVNVNSIYAVRRDVRYSAYSLSKSTVLALSGVLAGPLAEHGVFVFDISPGMVDTAMTRAMKVCEGRDDWTDPRLIVDAVVRVADGELDPLSGTFLHAGIDDLDRLLDDAGRIRATAARTLGMRVTGPDDPLAAG